MEIVQMDAFELPLNLHKVSPFVLRAPDGRLFVDSLLMGVNSGEALWETLEVENAPPQCQFDGAIFADLEWLLPRFKWKKTLFPDSRRKAAALIKRLCIEACGSVPRHSVEVAFI